jgi:hypothetical protein
LFFELIPNWEFGFFLVIQSWSFQVKFLFFLVSVVVGLTSLSKNRLVILDIVSIIEVKERMLGACFDGLIVSQYGFYDVFSSGYKYIHCDLIDVFGYMTIAFIVNFGFMTTFSNMLYVSYFVKFWFVACKRF